VHCENEQKLLFAGHSNVYARNTADLVSGYFAGKNNYEAADNGGSAGHKEINRTALSMNDIEEGLKTEIVKESKSFA
jgi:sucrose phosphorylase